MRSLLTFILTLHRIKSRPTRYFHLIIAAIVALFSLAYMHNYNIVYLMMFLTFSIAGASGVTGRLNLTDLRAEYLSNERLFANKEGSFTLKIHNDAKMKKSYAIDIETGESTKHLPIIEPQESVLVRLELQPVSRGGLKLPEIKICSLFPLPHEWFFKTVDLNQTVCIYPEPRGVSLDTFTASRRSVTGEQDDFDGIRSYRRGDPLSLIHWASIAKGSELMSKEFIYNEKSHTYYFDFLQSGDEDESRLSQLTLWTLESEIKGNHFIIKLPGKTLSSKEMEIDAILEQLAHY